MILPQIFIIIICIMAISKVAYLRGSEYTHKKNRQEAMVTALGTYAILAWGGFFDTIHWPQIVMLVAMGVTLLGEIFGPSSERKVYSLVFTILQVIISNTFLYLGGFYDKL